MSYTDAETSSMLRRHWLQQLALSLNVSKRPVKDHLDPNPVVQTGLLGQWIS